MLTLTSTIEITPTGGALGAFVTGFDASQPTTPEMILRLKQALHDYHILIFKHQTLSEEQLLVFATYFGSIFVPPSDVPVLGSKSGGKPPLVVTIANAAPEYRQGESFLENRELLPHSDHQWTPYPSSGSLLYAIDVPEEGGDTQWLNLVRAYAELDEATKEQIANLKLITHNPFLRDLGSTSATYRLNHNNQSYTPVFPHPLVRTHPESGKKILYLNCSEEVEVVDIDASTGAQLIEQLRQHIKQPRFAYNHQWSVGDLVYWDNQSTLHYRAAFDKNARRVLKRVSLAGSRPF